MFNPLNRANITKDQINKSMFYLQVWMYNINFEYTGQHSMTYKILTNYQLSVEKWFLMIRQHNNEQQQRRHRLHNNAPKDCDVWVHWGGWHSRRAHYLHRGTRPLRYPIWIIMHMYVYVLRAPEYEETWVYAKTCSSVARSQSFQWK